MIKRHFIIFLILFTIIYTSCKNESEKIDSSPKPEKIEDLGALYQHYNTAPTSQAQIDENKIIEFIAEHDISPFRTESGLYLLHKKVGNGKQIQSGDRLSVHYTGKLLDGKKFDSSYDRNKPLNFSVGQMIEGWNEGLLYLHEGSIATFIIPSELAYAERGFSDKVGPNEVLIFDLEILKVR